MAPYTRHLGGIGLDLILASLAITRWCRTRTAAVLPSVIGGPRSDFTSADATLPSAFVARWCTGAKAEAAVEVFREGKMARRRGLGRACIECHKYRTTPASF
jgi:hypothetical protein